MAASISRAWMRLQAKPSHRAADAAWNIPAPKVAVFAGSNVRITAWGLAIFTRNDKRVARSAPAETEN